MAQRLLTLIADARHDPENPEMTAWAILIRRGTECREVSGYRKGSRLSSLLHAIVGALTEEDYQAMYLLYVDHVSLKVAIDGNKIARWWADGWLTSDGQKIKDSRRWEQLFDQMRFHQLTYVGAPRIQTGSLGARLEELLIDATQCKYRSRQGGVRIGQAQEERHNPNAL